jgi:hypothetical protein
MDRVFDFVFSSAGGFAFGVTVAFLTIGAVTYSTGKNGVRSEAIDRGYAAYCPKNGRWAWIGECDPAAEGQGK